MLPPRCLINPPSTTSFRQPTQPGGVVGTLPPKAQPAKRTSRGELIYLKVKKTDVWRSNRREKRLFRVDTEGRGLDGSVVKFVVVLLWYVLFEA